MFALCFWPVHKTRDNVFHKDQTLPFNCVERSDAAAKAHPPKRNSDSTYSLDPRRMRFKDASNDAIDLESRDWSSNVGSELELENAIPQEQLQLQTSKRDNLSSTHCKIGNQDCCLVK